MLKNYFKIARRYIIKNKAFSFLNIAGLTSGLLCSLLIFLWVVDEVGIDNYHENGDRLYAVYEKRIKSNETNAEYLTQGLLSEELKRKIPEIEMASPRTWPQIKTFSNGDKTLKQMGTFVSQDYFSMFSFNFLEGTATTAMDSPDKIVISKEMAERFFGSVTDAIGQALTYQSDKQFQISAVFEGKPEADSEDYDFFMSWDYIVESNPWIKDWTISAPSTFVQLADNSDETNVSLKIKNFLDDYEIGEDENERTELHLQPFGDTYLYSEFENGEIAGGRIESVRIFGFIAFFILLVACINFMNLASAGSLKRAKEVGVRKVMGARKRGLVSQFMSEAVLLALISTVLALILLILALPAFNQLADKNLSLLKLSPLTWFGVIVVALITGILSGFYPAFILSSFKAIDIFKRKMNSKFSVKWIRQGLVVFQFSLSVILISCMIITSQQIQYIQNQNLGFDRHNLLTFSLEGDLSTAYPVLKNKALQLSGVESITLASSNPLQINNRTVDVIWNGKPKNESTVFAPLAIGTDFMKTWGSEMLIGQDFSSTRTADNDGFIINETAVKIMNLENPIGEPINLRGKEGTIIGVMKDFNFGSIKNAIEPLIIENGENAVRGQVLVRISPNNVVQTVESLKALHAELNPTFPFEYSFTDLEYNKLYKSETVFFKLSQYFAIIAIFISCLGLFGLVMFTAQQRVKEIGIRKVLGASVSSITSLLGQGFMKLVMLSIVIGSPIAWYLMSNWLEDYVYRIDMPWWAFGVAGILAISIALFTISFESIKAATANPIKSIMTE